MEQDKLRGAVIGCGYFGGIQLEAWKRMEDVEIVAACDPVADRAAAFASRSYSDPLEMMERESLDFVDIATRPDTHLALVRMAVERGVPAICQKPLAENLAAARWMRDLVRASGVPVMVHENWRWQPWYREARRLIDEGVIGRPLTYSFRHRQRDGLGDHPYPNQPYFAQMPRLLIHETLIHPIDTARFLFGPIDSVFARTRRVNDLIVGEDRAVLSIMHETKVDGIIDGQRFNNPEPPGPAMGDSIFEGDEGALRVLATGEIFSGTERLWSCPEGPGYKGDSVRATQRHFIDCLREGRPFETTIEDYLQSFTAVEAAYQSAESGRVVRPADVK